MEGRLMTLIVITDKHGDSVAELLLPVQKDGLEVEMFNRPEEK